MTADQLLTALFNAGIVVSVGATVLSLGMTFTVAELVAPLHRVALVVAVVIVAVPLWAGQVVSGASLSAWDIVKSLLLLVLIPLVAGLIAKARYTEHAEEWSAGLVRIANPALLIALAAGITVNWNTIVDLLGSWVLVASIITIAS